MIIKTNNGIICVNSVETLDDRLRADGIDYPFVIIGEYQIVDADPPTNDGKWDYVNGVFVRIPDTQEEVISLKISIMSKANNDASKLLEDITIGYPECEVKSWTQQNLEAEGWLADHTTPTPFLDALAIVRGMDKPTLVGKVVDKAANFAKYTGSVIGARQRVEDMVEAASSVDELQAIPTIEEILIGG